jgi:hypothetical protein
MAAVEAETLDPSTIHLTLSLQAVRVDKTRTSQVMKTLKGHLLDRPRCKSVWPDPDDDMHRLVLLHERYAAAGMAPDSPHSRRAVPLAFCCPPLKMERNRHHKVYAMPRS